jgi:8-oxo-dGTP pyrophosphatase MutT (NUDIX family)
VRVVRERARSRADEQRREQRAERADGLRVVPARRARALAMAAVRETFEETGLILGRAAPSASAWVISGFHELTTNAKRRPFALGASLRSRGPRSAVAISLLRA